MNAGIHKLTAGSGYLYLVRQVAAHDRTHGPESLGDYYSSKGETPGRWGGRGLAGLSAGSENWTRTDAGDRLWSVAEGSEVTEDQMKALFGLGVHPNASALTKQLIAQGARKNSALTATSLGRPFRVNAGETELQQRLAVAYRDHNLSIGAHLQRLTDVPFVLTVAHATDRAALLPMMNHLDRAAHDADRPLIWAAPPAVRDNPDLSPINPTVIDATTIDLTDSQPGTIIIIDRAQHLPPETIADLTENAAAANARIILLDTAAQTWPPPPAAPLLKLLHTELRWSPVLTAATPRINHYDASPDTDAALTQAAGLHPDQHTPAIANALQRHHKATQRNTTAHDLHTRMWNAAQRNDQHHRRVDHSRDI